MIEEERARKYNWAVGLVASGTFVMHTQSFVIGQVKKAWDGKNDPFVGPGSKEVNVPVFELSTGDVLMAEPDNFIECTTAEALFFQSAIARFAQVSEVGMHVAEDLHILPTTASFLVCAALRVCLVERESRSRKEALAKQATETRASVEEPK